MAIGRLLKRTNRTSNDRKQYMKYYKFSSFLKLILILTMGGGLNSHAVELVRITDLHVRLFLQTSGEFSPPLDGVEVLWDVVAGGGDATGPSSSAFVDVVVNGLRESWKVGRVVTLAVKSEKTGRVLFRMNTRLGMAGASGESHVGFWLSQIGCEPLELVAQVAGSSKARKLSFKCGE